MPVIVFNLVGCRHSPAQDFSVHIVTWVPCNAFYHNVIMCLFTDEYQQEILLCVRNEHWQKSYVHQLILYIFSFPLTLQPTFDDSVFNDSFLCTSHPQPPLESISLHDPNPGSVRGEDPPGRRASLGLQYYQARTADTKKVNHQTIYHKINVY